MIDGCMQCRGILLDKGEFDKIVEHLQEQISKKSIGEYLGAIGEEALEVFTGKEGFREGAGDLLMVTKLLFYRIGAQFPAIINIVKNLPK